MEPLTIFGLAAFPLALVAITLSVIGLFKQSRIDRENALESSDTGVIEEIGTVYKGSAPSATPEGRP